MMGISASRSVLVVLGLALAVLTGCSSGGVASNFQVASLLSADSCPTHTILAGLTAPSLDRTLAHVNAERGPQLTPLDSADLSTLGITPALLGMVAISDNDTAMVWRSPQYHDCQDLLAPGNTDQYLTRAGLLATAQAAYPAAVYASQPHSGLRVLMVHRLAGADYPNLRLDRDNLCVYLGADATGTNWWAAGLDCTVGDKVDSATVPAGRMLRVTRLTYGPQFTFTDYPPVGRWEWDMDHHEQAYGVKCGAAWCVIGVDTARIDPRRYGNAAQEVIPGWRDEQILAATTAATNPSAGTPSHVWAVIIPEPGLGHPTDTQLMAGNFLVGRMFVRGAAPKYHTKYGFDDPNPNPGLSGRYNIWLDSLKAIRVMKTPTDTVALLKVQYNHLGAQPVYAMRWAFTLNDENQWIPCPDGCCESGANLMF